MTPEQQRIAIAEACGKKFIFQEYGGKIVFFNDIPDYLNDLNAMHEAEKVLKTQNQTKSVKNLWRTYKIELWKIVNPEIRFQWDSEHWINCISATAEQRAEAFLRTIGKWEE